MSKFEIVCNWLNTEIPACNISRFEIGILAIIVVGIIVVVCNKKIRKNFFPGENK